MNAIVPSNPFSLKCFYFLWISSGSVTLCQLVFDTLPQGENNSTIYVAAAKPSQSPSAYAWGCVAHLWERERGRGRERVENCPFSIDFNSILPFSFASSSWIFISFAVQNKNNLRSGTLFWPYFPHECIYNGCTLFYS